MKLPIIIVFMLTPSMVFAQAHGEPVTLNSAILQARSNNKELFAMKRRLAILEAEALESAAYPNPSVEFEKETPFDSSYRELKIHQPFAISGRLGLAKRVSKAGIAAFEADVAALENEISAAAKKAYYSFRLAGERIRFEESNLKFSMDILNRMQLKLQTGQAGNSDVARAKVDVAQSKYRLEAANARLKTAEAELNYRMGNPPDTAVSIVDDTAPLNAPFPENARSWEDVLAISLGKRADLQALSRRVKAADSAIALEKRKRLPDLTLGWITGKDTTESYTKLSAGLELPLWYRNQGGIAKAAAGKTAIEEDAKQLELAIRREVYDAWLGKELAAKRVRAAREVTLSLNELRKTASLDYLSGKSTLTAFYETNRLFIEENLNYLDGLQEYYGKAADLEKAAGTAATGELQ